MTGATLPTPSPWRRLLARVAAWRRPFVRALPTALGVVILNFVLLQAIPGDAVDALVRRAGSSRKLRSMSSCSSGSWRCTPSRTSSHQERRIAMLVPNSGGWASAAPVLTT